MGYCLFYESMLDTVLYARDKWLKEGKINYNFFFFNLDKINVILNIGRLKYNLYNICNYIVIIRYK